MPLGQLLLEQVSHILWLGSLSAFLVGMPRRPNTSGTTKGIMKKPAGLQLAKKTIAAQTQDQQLFYISGQS